jgi:RNA polymerase sigma-70 factor (ECF subfamily)
MREADIHELLSHAEWLRGLARHLVRDGDEVSDVVQQTWVAALRSPPDGARPARPWLAQVLRNLVRKSARTDRNRGAREVAVSVPDAAALSPEALLESMQVQRLVGELVLALDEPYRSAILARYYEGLEPAQIADALGVPAGTIRWRVSEGVARLRAALDGRFGGHGRWRLTLVPLVSDKAPLKGALVMTKMKVMLAVVALGATVVSGGLVWRSAAAVHAGRASTAAASGPARPLALAAGTNEPSASGAAESPPAAPPRGKAPPRFLAPRAAGDGAAAGSGYGTLSKDDIRVGVRSVVPAIKDCYERWVLAENPGAGGRINIKFTIVEKEGAGHISDATIVPQTRDAGAGTPELAAPLTEACILEALTKATFAAPVGGPVVVTYPFLLTPSQQPSAQR